MKKYAFLLQQRKYPILLTSALSAVYAVGL